MKQSNLKWGWLGVVVLLLIASVFFMQPYRVLAQATATFTATSAPTATSVPTATPIATAYPIAQSLTGFAQGVRVGTYGLTWSTNGDGLQINGGQGLSVNSAAGRQVFHVNGATGDVTVYGGINVTGNFTPTGNIAATSIDIGGGYGSAGCTITTDGRLSCNDYFQTDSTITTGDATGSAGALYVTNGSGANTISLTGSTGVVVATTANVATLNATTVVSATAISIGTSSFSGTVHYGTSATYTSGAEILHGFSVTPTVCFISPSPEITATYTITATGFSSNTSSRSNPIYWMCGK